MIRKDNADEIYLDFDWLIEGFEKRKSNFSTIVCFETKDPKRYGQAIAFISIHADYKDAEIYSFDRWNGLRCLNGHRGKFVPVTRGIGGDYDSGIENEITDLKSALAYGDNILKSKRSVFILKDLDSFREGEKEQVLINALRAWAHDSDIFYTGSLVVLITGNIGHILDDMTSDFAALKRPPLASETERERIIMDTSQKLAITLGNNRKNLVRATAGLNLHQLESILLESYNTKGEFPLDEIKNLKAEFIKRSDLLELEEPNARGFKSVGGYECVKRFITHYIVNVLKDPTRAERFAVPLPRGILLFGPPGTGKTLFAKAMATETHLPFINFRTENLFSKYLGESGQKFRDAIRLAEQMSPAIVFIDEIDRFGRRTSGGGGDGASEETRRVFNQVLEWLGDEKRKAIIVGTTNRPQDLDEAFTRAGRFDYKIPFLYPGKGARRQILEIHLGLTGSKPRPPLDMNENDIDNLLELLASKTENFSGAELEQLIVRAKRNGFQSERVHLTQEDFLLALSSSRIDKERRERDVKEFLSLSATFTDDTEFLQEVESEK